MVSTQIVEAYANNHQNIALWIIGPSPMEHLILQSYVESLVCPQLSIASKTGLDICTKKIPFLLEGFALEVIRTRDHATKLEVHTTIQNRTRSLMKAVICSKSHIGSGSSILASRDNDRGIIARHQCCVHSCVTTGRGIVRCALHGAREKVATLALHLAYSLARPISLESLPVPMDACTHV